MFPWKVLIKTAIFFDGQNSQFSCRLFYNNYKVYKTYASVKTQEICYSRVQFLSDTLKLEFCILGALHHICSWPPHAFIYRSIIQVLWTPNQNLEYIIRIITRRKIRIIIKQPSVDVIFEQPESIKVTLYSNVYRRFWIFKEENWWGEYILVLVVKW